MGKNIEVYIDDMVVKSKIVSEVNWNDGSFKSVHLSVGGQM